MSGLIAARIFQPGNFRAVRIVEAQYPQGVIRQVINTQFAVGACHDHQCIGNSRGALVIFHDILATVGGRDIGLAPHVVIGNMNFIFGHVIAQVNHALCRVDGINAVRVKFHQLAEIIVGGTHGKGVAFRWLLRQVFSDNGFAAVVVRQSLEIPGIVNIGVARIDLDEAVGGCDGQVGFLVLVIGIGNFKFGLLCIAAKGIARLQDFEILDGLFVILLGQFFLGLGIQLVGRPVLGFIDCSVSQEQPDVDRMSTASKKLDKRMGLMCQNNSVLTGLQLQAAEV